MRSKFFTVIKCRVAPYLIRFAGSIGNTGWETIWEHNGNVNIALEQSSYQRDSFFSFLAFVLFFGSFFFLFFLAGVGEGRGGGWGVPN